MTRIEARAARVGEVRFSDVASQPADLERLTVHALTHSGCMVSLEVTFTEVWGGPGGWRRVLACPQCAGPCRVLSVTAATAGCARCVPRRTAHQLKKNRREWEASQFVDRLIRHAQGGKTEKGLLATLARRARRASAASASAALDAALRAIAAADSPIA